MTVTPTHAKQVTPQAHQSVSPDGFPLFLQCIFPISLFGPAQDVEKVVSGVAVDLDLECLLPGGHDFGRVLLVEHLVKGVGLAAQLVADVGDDSIGSADESQSGEYPDGAGDAY